MQATDEESTPATRYSPLHQLKSSRTQSERVLLREALAWMQALGVEGTPSDLPPDTATLFADCWLIGRTADAVQAVRRAHQGAGGAWRPPPSPSPSLTPGAQQRRTRTFRDRINDYSKMERLCRELGLRSDLLPPLVDIEQGQGVFALAAAIWTLADECNQLGLPVPAFGDAGSLLRRSMPREASARRAELFARDGSPPKMPAMNLLLTPRAFTGKGGATLLRDSNGNLRHQLLQRTGSGPKVDARARTPGEYAAEGAAAASGLGETIAALERVSAEAQQTADVLAAERPVSEQRRQRPALPRLDVEAAAAQAAAEAGADGDGAGPAAWDSDDRVVSPLSSPTASSLASPSGHGYASSSVMSSPEPGASASASPARPAFRHAHAMPAGIDNPLWSQSPQLPPDAMDQDSAPATADGAEAAGAQESAAHSTASHVRHDPTQADSPTASSQGRSEQLPELGSPTWGAADGGSHGPSVGGDGGASRAQAAAEPDPWHSMDSVGGDGGLLESLLSPPLFKPAHTRLLGALMHTAPPVRDRGASAAEAMAAVMAEAAEKRGDEEFDAEGAAVPAVHDATPAPASAEDANAAAVEEASQPAALQAVPAAPGTSSSRGSLRRLALLVLGAMAGAAATVAASAVQQQRRDRRHGSSSRPRPLGPLLHAQPVPSMRNARRQVLSEHTEREVREARRAVGRQPAAGGSRGSPSWRDDPHSLTQG